MKKTSIITLLPFFLLVACGCGPTPAQRPAAGQDDGSNRSAPTFSRIEDELLHDLAALDRRLAVRLHVTPTEEDLRRVTMAAMLREDPTVVVNDGSIDPFSFDARARGLDGAKKKLAALPATKVVGPTAVEYELLGRLLDEEIARLDEERRLPRSASALIRAIVETWQAPGSEREALDDDRWLARRLSELRESMTTVNRDPTVALDVVRARELDDQLDALEHLTPAPVYTKTTQELVRTREALEAVGSRPAAKAESDWNQVEPRVRAHLGSLAPEDLVKSLAKLEADLRTKATQAVAAANLSRDALAANLEKVIFMAGFCQDAIPDSRIRSTAAPQEREPGCHLRHLVTRTTDDATLLAALHDHVVIAQWALDVARGTSTIAQAQAEHPLLYPVLPDVRARYERIALARPVAAIGAGEAARLLLDGGDLKARAAKWSSLGEMPFDIARRELAK